MPDLDCRVAKLEERFEAFMESCNERRRREDRTNELLEEIRTSLQREISTLKNEISEIKGFGNGLRVGAVLVVGILSSGITAVLDRIFMH